MNQGQSTRTRSGRSGLMLAAGSVGALLFLLGFAPHDERALFLNDGDFQAKAFVATIAPLNLQQAQSEAGLLNHLALLSSDARRRNRAGRRGSSGGRGLDVPAKALLADAGPEPFVAPVAAGSTANLADSGLPVPSGGLVPGGSSGNDSPSPSSTPSGGPPATPPGVAGPIGAAPGTPVSSVPEPATWLTLLFGFFMVGSGMRRRPNRCLTV